MIVSVRKRYNRRKLQRKEKKEKKNSIWKILWALFYSFFYSGKSLTDFQVQTFSPAEEGADSQCSGEMCYTWEPRTTGFHCLPLTEEKKSYKVRWVLALQFQVFSQNKILRKPEILHGTIRLNQQYLLHWSILTIKLFLFWNATYLIFRNCQGIPEQSLPSTWLLNYSHDLSG